MSRQDLRRIGSITFGAFLLAGSAAPEGRTSEAPQAALEQRPTDVTVVMSTSRKKYDGTYTLSHRSRACGEVTQAMIDAFQHVSRMFLVEFPVVDGGDYEVNDVTFNSKALVGGVTTTTKFYLSVGVKSPRIGHPAEYVLDTSKPDMTGTATLTTPSAGTVQLKVDGVNDRGETVNLTVVCAPRRDQ